MKKFKFGKPYIQPLYVAISLEQLRDRIERVILEQQREGVANWVLWRGVDMELIDIPYRTFSKFIFGR